MFQTQILAVLGHGWCCESDVRPGSHCSIHEWAHSFMIRHVPHSSSFVGDWDFDSGTDGSMGVAHGFKLLKLNLVIIASIYTCWDNEIVFSTRSWATFSPKSEKTGPKLVILHFLFMSSLNFLMSSTLFPVTIPSSTCIAKIIMSPPICLKNIPWSASDLVKPSSNRALCSASYQFFNPCFNPHNTFINLYIQCSWSFILYPGGCSR